MLEFAAQVLAVALLPAALVLLVWMVRSPARALAAYAAVLPFGSAISLPLGLPSSFTTISSLLGLTALMTYSLHWLGNRTPLRIQSLSLPVWLLFTALALASVGWSIRTRATLDAALVLVSLVALFVVVAISPMSRNDLARMRVWISAGGGLTGAYALLLAASGNLPTTGAGLPRFEVTGGGGGQGGDPNITAAALIVPIAVALWEGFNPERSRRARVCFLLSAAFAGIGVLLTGSRGGALSIVIVALVTLYTHRRGLWSLLLIGSLILPAALLSPSTFQERLENTGTTGRTAIWRLAIESCPQYCPIGSGFGTFADVHEAAFLTSEGAEGTRFRYQAHSIWFGTLIELGVAGFLLLAIGITITARDLIRIPAETRGGALAGLAGMVFSSTFLSNLTFKYFWLILMYSVLVVGQARSSPAERSMLPQRLDHSSA